MKAHKRIVVPFNEFIHQSTPGVFGESEKPFDGIRIFACQQFCKALGAYLKERKLDFVYWNSDRVRVSSNREVVIDNPKSDLLALPDNIVTDFRKRLDGEINAYYQMQAACGSLYFNQRADVQNAKEFSLSTALGLVKRIVSVINLNYASQLMSPSGFEIDYDFVLENSIGLSLNNSHTIEPRDLLDILDIERIHQFVVDWLDIDKQNEGYQSSLARWIAEPYTYKTDFKHHHTMQLFPAQLTALKNVLKILGHDGDFVLMRVAVEGGCETAKVKVSGAVCKKLGIFINRFAKDKLERTVRFKEKWG